MKENDAKIEFESHQLLLYVEKTDGEYGPLQTGSYLTKNYVDDFWEKRKKFSETTLKKLTSGQVSPIGYYMLMIDISAAELAARLGIRVNDVKKHQEPLHFGKITIEILKKYAVEFGITLADMFQVQVPSSTHHCIQQEKTSNPFVTTITVVKETK